MRATVIPPPTSPAPRICSSEVSDSEVTGQRERDKTVGGYGTSSHAGGRGRETSRGQNRGCRCLWGGDGETQRRLHEGLRGRWDREVRGPARGVALSRGSPAGSWGRRCVSSGPATPHLLRCLTPATQRFKYLHLSASQTTQVTRGISRGALSWLLVCMGMALPLPGDTQTQSQPDPSPTPLSPFWDPPLPCPHPQGLFLLCKKVISAVANVSFLFDSHTA